ncbi:MAG: hypothetical protein NVS1B3_10900 [Candidatus Dormibacteraceae bacterium]
MTAPAPRVVYQRRVSLTGRQRDPPETAMGASDDGVIGVDEGCKPEGVTVDVLELEVAVLGELAVVPGIV